MFNLAFLTGYLEKTDQDLRRASDKTVYQPGIRSAK